MLDAGPKFVLRPATDMGVLVMSVAASPRIETFPTPESFVGHAASWLSGCSDRHSVLVSTGVQLAREPSVPKQPLKALRLR